MKRTPFLWVTLAGTLALASCRKESTPTASSGTSGSPPPPAGATKVLKFSAIPNQNSTELKAKFDPVAAHLAKVLGVSVEFVPSADYKASVELFKNGQVQFAWFGGVTGVQARAAIPGARAIVQGKEDTAYKSYFVAHKDAGLEKSDAFPAAIGGLKFAFGSESSTSGRVMPSYYITKNTGKKEAEFFTTPPVFSGAHDKTLALVAAGEVQAGVCDYALYEKQVAEKKLDPAIVKVIWETPTFIDYNFTAHPELETTYGAGFTDKLQAALIAMSTDAPDLLKVFPRSALIEAKNEDYALLADLCKQIGLIR